MLLIGRLFICITGGGFPERPDTSGAMNVAPRLSTCSWAALTHVKAVRDGT